jgi:threonine dehydrogenase-like Zn-dependent dehydrogenase
MRAARLHGPAQLVIEDVARPEPGPGEVLVQVVAYAPYGTDVGVYLNKQGRYVSEYPVGVGADFSGVVAALGEGVRGLALGDRVTALALDHCGACENCREGRTNLCLSPEFAAPARQTCCAEYTLVSARKIARLPKAVGFDDAAMLAGVVDALNAYEKMALAAGDDVAVVGVGAMGLGAIATARALGLSVVAVGGTGARADLAARLGARAVVRLSRHGEDVTDAALAHAGHGFAAVIETTATSWGLTQAFAIAAPGGTVAVTGGGPLPVTSWDMVNRELRIVGVRAGHHQEQALALIASGALDLKPTIGARFPLEAAAEAFALLTGPRAADIGRVIIDCRATPAGSSPNSENAP